MITPQEKVSPFANIAIQAQVERDDVHVNMSS